MDSIRYSFMPVITLGLEDAFNPYALSISLAFFIMLLFFGKDIKRIYLFGAVFLLVSIWINYNILMGQFDPVFNLSKFSMVAEYAYLALATALIIFGIFKFLDWRILRNNRNKDNCFVKTPCYYFAPADGDQKRKKISGIFYLFSTINIAFWFAAFAYAFAFFQTLWEKNYYLTLMYYFISSGKHLRFGVQSYYVYSVFYSMLNMVALIIAVIIFKRWKKFRDKSKDLLLIQIVLAITSVGIGVGLVCLNLV